MIARRPILAALAVAIGAALFAAGPVRAEAPFITVASTTSTEQSGSGSTGRRNASLN